MTTCAEMLRTLLELEADDQGAAVAFAHEWTEAEWRALMSSREIASADLYHALCRLREIEVPQSQLFVDILSDAALIVERDAHEMRFEGNLAPAPTWLAGIQGPDGEVSYRGLSILGGQTGVGKSKLATRAALLACSNPATAVVYLCAELDEPTTALYARQCTGLEPREVIQRFPNFRPVMIPAGCSYGRVVEATLRSVPSGCSRLIIVADTINTLVEKCQEDDRGYFSLLRQFGIWMLESRIRSEGRIAWLAVSELNKEDAILGAKLDKWADFVLRFRRGDMKNQVHIDVPKGRFSGSEELGTYFLNWQTCEMERA